MRLITFASASLLIGSSAMAGHVPRLDLDRPGVLEQMKQQHPQRYLAVHAVLVASERAPCEGGKLELLKTGLNVTDAECGMKIIATYPALRHVRFELDGINYSATVELNGNDTLLPISTAIDRPAIH